jgi:hypothetical protein
MKNSLNIVKVSNAVVELNVDLVKGHPVLTILVSGQYFHQFPTASRESRSVLTTDIDILRANYNGGTYVFAIHENGTQSLIDYRPSTYRGFVHSDDSFAKMQEVIGSTMTNVGRQAVNGLLNEAGKKSAPKGTPMLGGQWSSFDLDVKSLGIGGEFKNRLIYKYSLFSPNIVTSFETERLICSNGMVSNSALVTFEVPVINDWENNLHVVSAQLQPKINDILHSRFEHMAKVRATVSECLSAQKVLNERLASISGDFADEGTYSDRDALDSLVRTVDVTNALSEYYKPEVFSGDRAKLASSHLTQFDVFNVLTEAASHTSGSEVSDANIQTQVNRIVYDSLRNKQLIASGKPLSTDSDHRRQFFRKP